MREPDPAALAPHLRQPWWVLVLCLIAAIAVADYLTAIEVAVACLYVVPILLAAAIGQVGITTFVGTLCALLTLIGTAANPNGDFLVGMTNCLCCLVALSATTFLAIRSQIAVGLSRQAQSELARLSRIMTVNEMTTTIAHEVGQPLTSIIANAGAASRWLRMPGGEEETRKALERICRDARRTADTIDRVRQLARRVPPTRTIVECRAVIQDAVALLRHSLDRNRIDLRISAPQREASVSGDGVQLQQVMTNLILNAIESIAQAGTGPRLLTITVSDEAQVVRIEVADTGSGIPATDVERLFAPFYTTKADGIGVGLAISRSIIEAHGGNLYAVANNPRGACFGFVLPRRDPAA